MGRAHNNLGLLLLGQERYGEAVTELREAVKALPDSAEPRRPFDSLRSLRVGAERRQEKTGVAAPTWDMPTS